MRSPPQHIGHKQHLCSLAANGTLSLEKIKLLTRNAQYICTVCGRSAILEENLCQPEPFDFGCGACGRTFSTQTELLEHTCLPLG